MLLGFIVLLQANFFYSRERGDDCNKFAGISLYRFFHSILFWNFDYPFSIYFNGWIVPKSNSAKLNFERIYLNKTKLSE